MTHGPRFQMLPAMMSSRTWTWWGFFRCPFVIQSRQPGLYARIKIVNWSTWVDRLFFMLPPFYIHLPVDLQKLRKR